MVIQDEDLIICDFAQFYNIIDWRAIPINTAAILACGLPENSRIIRKLSGNKHGIDTMLNSLILDNVRNLTWAIGARNGSRPEPITTHLFNLNKASTSDACFDSAEEYERARAEILDKIGE